MFLVDWNAGSIGLFFMLAVMLGVMVWGLSKMVGKSK